jgi:dTDP-4-dehydrorhamnose reductase
MELTKNAISVTREEFDLEKMEFFPSESGLRPSAIINAAAYTAVDKAEEEEVRAHNINARAPEILARYCREQDIPFVHYSTDYVFDGSGKEPWKETDATNPLSAYGRTKREGEKRIEAVGGKYLIFRTSWVYDETGKNFVNTMLRLGTERDELRVVNDQWGAPTYARHLAQATLAALENAQKASRFPSGIYHLCGGGETNWQAFAREIFALRHCEERSDAAIPKEVWIASPSARDDGMQSPKIHGIPSSEYPTPAKRPMNSRLDCSKAKQVLGVTLPAWEAGLKECLERRNESHRLSA